VRLKRPELSKPSWKDAEGNETAAGLTEAALGLSVSCNADTEEGAAVIFRVYPRGADPEQDSPAAELSSANTDGAAEAEWTYHYKQDPAGPLKAKPRFFFTARGQRCKTVTSGTMEISQTINIHAASGTGEPLRDLPYELYHADTCIREGVTGEKGLITEEDLIPGEYSLLIKPKEEKNGP
jgi:hypothetical protein